MEPLSIHLPAEGRGPVVQKFDGFTLTVDSIYNVFLENWGEGGPFCATGWSRQPWSIDDEINYTVWKDATPPLNIPIIAKRLEDGSIYIYLHPRKDIFIEGEPGCPTEEEAAFASAFHLEFLGLSGLGEYTTWACLYPHRRYFQQVLARHLGNFNAIVEHFNDIECGPECTNFSNARLAFRAQQIKRSVLKSITRWRHRTYRPNSKAYLAAKKHFEHFYQ